MMMVIIRMMMMIMMVIMMVIIIMMMMVISLQYQGWQRAGESNCSCDQKVKIHKIHKTSQELQNWPNKSLGFPTDNIV